MSVEPSDYRALSPAGRRRKRMEYIRAQGRRCIHCGQSLDGPHGLPEDRFPIDWRLFPRGKRFLDHPVHLHHDHVTGLTIGAVHAYCNAALWQYHGE